MAAIAPDGGCWLAFESREEAASFAAALEDGAGRHGAPWAPALAYSFRKGLPELLQDGPGGSVRARLGPVAFSDLCRLMAAAAGAGDGSPCGCDRPSGDAWSDELMRDIAKAIDREYDAPQAPYMFQGACAFAPARGKEAAACLPTCS